MNKYKVGDITDSGYEILEVNMQPIYKMRKRIKLIRDWGATDKKGDLGWFIMEGFNHYVLLDKHDNPNRMCRVSDRDIEFVKHQ